MAGCNRVPLLGVIRLFELDPEKGPPMNTPEKPSYRPNWFPALLVITVISLLVSSTGTASAQEVTAQPVEQLRLVCHADSIGDQRGVLCKWSEARVGFARGYKLHRSVDGAARELVATVGADERLAHFDTNVSSPSRITYGVVALNRFGRVIGLGGPVTVQLSRPNEELRFDCHRDSIAGRRGVLCQWSPTERPDARGYLLFRSIDYRERQVIARIGLDGRASFFDTEVHPGSVHIYYVAVVNAAGEVIGTGGPDRVHWPEVTDRVTDRLTDGAPG